MVEVQTATEDKKETLPTVPDYLVYEVVKGQPIYYKGYKAVLNNTKTFEEITMESRLQAWLKSQIVTLLNNFLLQKGLIVTVGELGLKMQNETNRGADIAVFKPENWVLDEHFSNLPPEIILEIDVQADTNKEPELYYIIGKINDYLAFGVKKVIWIFTRERKVMVATKDAPWLTHDWHLDIEIWEEVTLNLQTLVEPMEKK